MVRLLLTSLLAFTALSLSSAESADACGYTSCQAVIASFDLAQHVESAAPARQARRIAPASDEAEVRARDLAKLEPQAPAFWMQFKSYAYEQLPTHEKKNFSAVWIAMAVETPDETVAGVGLQGIWW